MHYCIAKPKDSSKQRRGGKKGKNESIEAATDFASSHLCLDGTVPSSVEL
jgi:hypothetical protein